MKPSTKNLECIPEIDELRKICQSIAMLDAILSPEWEYRYYSFNAKWDKGEMMASMRNGCGDEYFILFTTEGAIIKGFYHESEMSPYGRQGEVWDGVLSQVPKEFEKFLAEPAFNIGDTTFCIWRLFKDKQWNIGNISIPHEITSRDADPDGSEFLLSKLDGNPLSYKEYAKEYFEKDVEMNLVEKIYRHEPLTSDIVQAFNGEAGLDSLADDIAEIGYPISGKP